MTRLCLHLARAGRSLGQREIAEVTAALVVGELSLSDLSWREGEPGWVALGERPEFAAAEGLPPLPEPALERWRAIGLPRAAGLTLRETLLAPASTFGRLPASGSCWPPLALHLAVACLANALGLLWAAWMVRPIWERSLGILLPFLPWEQVYRFFMWLALVTPILVALGAWVAPTLLHLALRACGGGRGGWGVSFRVTNYVGAAANLVLALPYVGILAFPWSAHCLVAGLAAAHRDPVWRPALALVMAGLFACCAIAAAAWLALVPFLAELGG